MAFEPPEFKPRSNINESAQLSMGMRDTYDAQNRMSFLSTILRLAFLAMILFYFLSLAWRPAPRALLSARQYITTNVESAVAWIDELIGKARR
jgi:hypothetical protein